MITKFLCGARHGVRSYLGYLTMETARGNTILNLVDYLGRYLLAFLVPFYLSNSQSYVIVKFTSHAVSKIHYKLSMLRISPQCAASGKNILTPVSHTFLYNLPKFHEIISQIEKNEGT